MRDWFKEGPAAVIAGAGETTGWFAPAGSRSEHLIAQYLLRSSTSYPTIVRFISLELSSTRMKSYRIWGTEPRAAAAQRHDQQGPPRGAISYLDRIWYAQRAAAMLTITP